MKRSKLLYILMISMLMLSACSGSSNTVSTNQADAAASGSLAADPQTQVVSSAPLSSDYDSDDLAIGVEDSNTTLIRLEGDSVSVEGEGAVLNGATVTITAAKTYSIQGVLNDGQLVVDTQDEETVVLILNNASITNLSGAAVYVANAEKTVITLAEGSQNYVTDGQDHLSLDEDSEPDAAIFSHDDLTINGSGALTVNANYNDGISCKDDLIIISGTVTVTAVHDGIKGRDSVSIMDGDVTVSAGADGIQATNAEEAERGYVLIEGGKIEITAGLDGIQAETSLSISGGELVITTGGGSGNGANTSQQWGSEDPSAKGLKAGVDVTISGGVLYIDAADDAVHSNGTILISSGVFQLSSGDDGIYAETSLTINGGEVNVINAVEGLESAVITINDGIVRLVTSDDGLNATTGSGGEQVDGSYFYLNGGYVFIDALGDGLDSNGTAIMSGGVVIVQGFGQSPLDVNGEFEINGGILIAAGNSFMAEVPSTNSTQNSIAIMLDSMQAGGTIVHIETENGQEILTYESPNDFQLFVFSSPDLLTGTTYDVYVGGTAVGTVTDGVYSESTYTYGALAANLQISSSVTALGSFDDSGGRGHSHP